VAHCSTVGKEDFDMYMNKMEQPPRSDEEHKKLVPTWIYDKMKEKFNPIAANKLPPRRPGVDHAIETDGVTP
jgi:hypothetical protein